MRCIRLQGFSIHPAMTVKFKNCEKQSSNDKNTHALIMIINYAYIFFFIAKDKKIKLNWFGISYKVY